MLQGGRDGSIHQDREHRRRREFEGEDSELNFRHLMFACGTSNKVLDICIWSSGQGAGRT